MTVTKAKMKKWDYIKLRTFYIGEVKLIELEKIFATNYKGLLPKICTELLAKQIIQSKNGQGHE